MRFDHLITTQAEIEEVVRACKVAGSMAIDTEFLRERTYRAKLCLVQIAAAEDLWLIDPLARVDVTPIADLVADPSVRTLVHAGRQDFELFFERFGTTPRNVFDVQLAAGFVGLGASLPYGRVVAELAGETIEKGEAYTDWCKRPLTDSQKKYAAADVLYLYRAVAEVERRIEELGRSAWVAEEMIALEEPETYGTDPADAWRRVSGKGTLNGKQMAVLQEVAAWREETAARRDLPRGWVVKDPTLVEIARRAPADLKGLKAIRGLNDKEAQRSAHDIVAAVRAGLAKPPVSQRAAPPKSIVARARMLSGLADAIVRARCEEADMATELVATRGELESLLAAALSGTADRERHRLLRGWRKELAGDAVIALVEGRIAVKAIDKPPFVEEVPL